MKQTLYSIRKFINIKRSLPYIFLEYLMFIFRNSLYLTAKPFDIKNIESESFLASFLVPIRIMQTFASHPWNTKAQDTRKIFAKIFSIIYFDSTNICFHPKLNSLMLLSQPIFNLRVNPPKIFLAWNENNTSLNHEKCVGDPCLYSMLHGQ